MPHVLLHAKIIIKITIVIIEDTLLVCRPVFVLKKGKLH